MSVNVDEVAIMDYKENEGLYLRAFFSDSSFNVNDWGVTQQALNRDIATGVQRDYEGVDGVMRTAPLIDTPDDSHPSDDVEDMIKEQEPFRKGDFLRTGIDPITKRAYADVIVRDPITIQRIQNKELQYVSPSIRALEAMRTNDGKILATKFRINHLALVKNPAYGKMKAQIKGTCMGTAEQCLPVLSNIQANTKVELMSCGGVDIHISANSVPEKLKDLIKQGNEITMKMVSDTMEPPMPCKKCGQPLIDHNASTDHEYIAEDSTEQVNEDQSYGADDCVSKWIPELKSAHPDWKQDQVVAVAYAKCKKGENASAEERPLEKLEGQLELPCLECKKTFSSEEELDKHLKDHEIKALKDKNTNIENMSSQEETKKKDEEHEKEMAKQAEDMKKIREDNANMKATIDSLKATVDSEVKTPIVQKIVQARIKAGSLKQADSNKVAEELMAHDIPYLKTLEADYSAMIKLADKPASSPGVSQPRFSLSASVSEGDKDLSKSVAETIRRRIT